MAPLENPNKNPILLQKTYSAEPDIANQEHVRHQSTRALQNLGAMESKLTSGSQIFCLGFEIQMGFGNGTAPQPFCNVFFKSARGLGDGGGVYWDSGAWCSDARFTDAGIPKFSDTPTESGTPVMFKEIALNFPSAAATRVPSNPPPHNFPSPSNTLPSFPAAEHMRPLRGDLAISDQDENRPIKENGWQNQGHRRELHNHLGKPLPPIRFYALPRLHERQVSAIVSPSKGAVERGDGLQVFREVRGLNTDEGDGCREDNAEVEEEGRQGGDEASGSIGSEVSKAVNEFRAEARSVTIATAGRVFRAVDQGVDLIRVNQFAAWGFEITMLRFTISTLSHIKGGMEGTYCVQTMANRANTRPLARPLMILGAREDPPKQNLTHHVERSIGKGIEEVRNETSPESKEAALGTQVTEGSKERRGDIVPLLGIDSKNGRRLAVALGEREHQISFSAQYSTIVKRGGITNRKDGKPKENENSHDGKSGIVHFMFPGVATPLYQTRRGFEEQTCPL
ncbi:unnamed protein product [Tuber aestivum]|uniref:Uncharacterized protein n=1 Tax=Tuber aestivum TaxID=59557 RepID=A0A292PPM6_9PEZI|nr:unnamed protein product [Tuber aestivum]